MFLFASFSFNSLKLMCLLSIQLLIVLCSNHGILFKLTYSRPSLMFPTIPVWHEFKLYVFTYKHEYHKLLSSFGSIQSVNCSGWRSTTQNLNQDWAFFLSCIIYAITLAANNSWGKPKWVARAMTFKGGCYILVSHRGKKLLMVFVMTAGVSYVISRDRLFRLVGCCF